MAATGLAGSLSVIQLDADHASLTLDGIIDWRMVVALTTRVVGLLTALAHAQQQLDKHASAAEPPLVGPIPRGGPRPCPR